MTPVGWCRAGCLVAVGLSLAAVPATGAATLRPDGRFGEGGIARVPVRTGSEAVVRPLRPVRQPDGNVLVSASIVGDRGDPAEVVLARFTRDGRPDATFGRGGRVRLGARWNFDPRAVLVQPDGRIVLMGAAGRGINSLYPLVAPAQLGLIRLLPDGSRDRAFGTDGFVAWNPPWRPSTRLMQTSPGLLLQADGRLLVAASVDDLRAEGPAGSNVDVDRVAFARFDANGSLDESFGSAGVVETPDGSDYFAAWAALPGGHLVVLHSRNEGLFAPRSWWLDRFTANGALDSGFGSGGSVRLGSIALVFVQDLVAAGDGSLVLVGSNASGDTRTMLHRILPDGQLDAGFGTACRRRLRDFGWGGAAVTSAGRVLVSATTYVTSGGRRDSVFARYDARGCVAERPLRLRAFSAGPPLLQGRHAALAGATYRHGLALIRIRR